jgi:hypothetical protein
LNSTNPSPLGRPDTASSHIHASTTSPVGKFKRYS